MSASAKLARLEPFQPKREMSLGVVAATGGEPPRYIVTYRVLPHPWNDYT